MILTNTSTSVNPKFQIGDIVLIEDHINLSGFMGNSPLIGLNDDRLGERFTPLNNIYNSNLIVLSSKNKEFSN